MSVAADPPRTFHSDLLTRSRPTTGLGSDGDRGTPCASSAQVTAGKDLYVSETTDLVVNGALNGDDSSEAPAASGQAGRSRRRGSGLSGMLLPELQQLAAELGIAGTARMRKGDLVAAISARQGGDGGSAGAPAARTATEDAPASNGAVVNDAVSSNGGIAASAAPLEAPISGGAN